MTYPRWMKEIYVAYNPTSARNNPKSVGCVVTYDPHKVLGEPFGGLTYSERVYIEDGVWYV